MELVKIATGEPITRAQIEAEWIAAQPATILVEQTIDGENGPELVLVETPNHPEFPLPEDLWRFDLTEFGVTVPIQTEPPVAGEGEKVERDGVELVAGEWRVKWRTRPLTAEEQRELVPASITRRQARIVLSRHGHLAAVEEAIAAMPGQAGEEARIDWADALEFRRDYPLIETMRLLRGLTEEQVDDMYIEAAAIV